MAGWPRRESPTLATSPSSPRSHCTSPAEWYQQKGRRKEDAERESGRPSIDKAERGAHVVHLAGTKGNTPVSPTCIKPSSTWQDPHGIMRDRTGDYGTSVG